MNILIVDQKPVLIDLDDMRRYTEKEKKQFGQEFQKNMERFLKNWTDYPKIMSLFHNLIMG